MRAVQPRRRIFSLQGIPLAYNRPPPPGSCPLLSPVILPPVLVLYIVYVACTVALVAAAIGVARHVIRHRRAARAAGDPPDESH